MGGISSGKSDEVFGQGDEKISPKEIFPQRKIHNSLRDHIPSDKVGPFSPGSLLLNLTKKRSG